MSKMKNQIKIMIEFDEKFDDVVDDDDDNAEDTCC